HPIKPLYPSLVLDLFRSNYAEFIVDAISCQARYFIGILDRQFPFIQLSNNSLQLFDVDLIRTEPVEEVGIENILKCLPVRVGYGNVVVVERSNKRIVVIVNSSQRVLELFKALTRDHIKNLAFFIL